MYDEESFDFLTVKYLQEHGFPATTEEDRDKLLQGGYAYALPPHWQEVPELEAVEGEILIRPVPQGRAGR